MDQLTRDVLAAEEAGLTYGKYKGLQYEREQAAIAAAQRAREEERARRRAEKEAAQAAARAAMSAEEQAEDAAKAEEIAHAEMNRAWKKVYTAKPKTTCCRWCGKEFPYNGRQMFCNAKCKHHQQVFNQRKSYHKKKGMLPPKKEEFLGVM